MIAHFQNSQPNLFSVERSSGSLSPTHEIQNILLKLYDFLSQYEVVKMGSKALEPLYHSGVRILDDKATMLFNILSNYITNVSIYNHAVSVWLSQNPPGSKELRPYEKFLSSLKSRSRSEGEDTFNQAALNFYEVASLDWELTKGFSSKKLEELIFKIVAKTLNKNLGFPDEVYSQLLFNILRSLLKEKFQLLNQDLFTQSVWDQLDGTHKARGFLEIQRASIEFYTFAKRFFLVESPKKIANQSLFKIGEGLVLDRLFRWSNCSLSFVEENLNKLMKFFEIGYSGSKEASNLFQKAERIMRKIFIVALHPVKVSAEKTLKYQSNQYYMTLDKYFGLTGKLEEVVYKSLWGYDILKANVVLPVVDWFGVKIEKTKSFIVVSIGGINVNAMKRQLTRIRDKFEVIKGAIIVYEKRVIKFVFNEESLTKVGENLINELFRLSLLLRGWETEKLREVGHEYYQWLVKGKKRVVKEIKETSGDSEERIHSPKRIAEESDIVQVRTEETSEQSALHIQEESEIQKVEEISTEVRSPQNKPFESVEAKKEEHFSEGTREISTENGESHHNSDEGSTSEKKEQLLIDSNDQKIEEKFEHDTEDKIDNQDQEETQEQGKAEKKKKKKKRAL